jgi:uncharacterized membrane protein YqaE (UPF0057 family)
MLSLLAILCPPAAVILTGRPSQAAVNLVLTLLFYFPGLFHALWVVGEHKTRQRNETLVRLVALYESRPSYGLTGRGHPVGRR